MNSILYAVADMTPASGTFLTTREVADLVRLSPRTLERMRQTGDGPPYRRLGSRVRYSRADVLAWVDRQTRLSTSDGR